MILQKAYTSKYTPRRAIKCVNGMCRLMCYGLCSGPVSDPPSQNPLFGIQIEGVPHEFVGNSNPRENLMSYCHGPSELQLLIDARGLLCFFKTPTRDMGIG